MRFSSVLFICLTAIGTASALTYKGADISSVAVVERNGITYKDTNGSSGKLEAILKTHGMNTARIRVWTSSGDYGLTYSLALAKRIKAAGLTLIVDLHFSDTWADPGHQAIPSGWGTSVSSLNSQIYTYTKNLVTSFASQGTTIDILQLGNEIDDGLLWNTGKASTAGWSPAPQFLHSARQGARDAGFGGKVSIHIADGWNQSTQDWFWNNVIIQGAFSTSDFDIVAVSFYPFYNTAATLSSLKSVLTNLANKFGKPVMVAETDWPATSSCGSITLSASYAESPSGQLSWIAAIRDVLNAMPNGLGAGILYWEPGWIGNANLGSGCADNLLFDSTGKARSSVAIFSNM